MQVLPTYNDIGKQPVPSRAGGEVHLILLHKVHLEGGDPGPGLGCGGVAATVLLVYQI